ncbi:hypothetical protein ACN469_23430 [Corallococcus terminator]
MTQGALLVCGREPLRLPVDPKGGLCLSLFGVAEASARERMAGIGARWTFCW